MSDLANSFPDNSMKDFEVSSGNFTIGHNFRTDSFKGDFNNLTEYREENFVYFRVRKYGDTISAAMSKVEATRLRDHLTVLLGETEQSDSDDQPFGPPLVEQTAPVVTDAAVMAMEELAHELNLFSTDDLVDALNRHSDVMSRVHNL